MNLSKHFLLIELKRKMFYKLQNVIFIEFNIINDIYELTRQTQLKENHYKRIDDAKSCRRSSAVVTIDIETKAAINRIMNIITISISINVNRERVNSFITWPNWLKKGNSVKYTTLHAISLYKHHSTVL